MEHRGCNDNKIIISYPYTKYVRSKNQNDMNRNDHSNFKIFRRGQEQGWKVGRVYVHRHQYVQLI
jgi:hypothetical protein